MEQRTMVVMGPALEATEDFGQFLEIAAQFGTLLQDREGRESQVDAVFAFCSKCLQGGEKNEAGAPLRRLAGKQVEVVAIADDPAVLIQGAKPAMPTSSPFFLA